MHRELVVRVLLGPAHHVGARRREPHGCGDQLDDEVNSEIADGYATGSARLRRRWPRRSACRWRPTRERRPRWAARVMTLGEPRGVGGLAGTVTGYAFVVHGFEC